MDKWSYTLADIAELMFELRADRSKPFDPARTATMVIAPCCGRRTAADTVVDCRGIAGTIVSGGGWRAPEDHGWLCDGCLHRLYADPTNDWTTSKMLAARIAPAALINEYKTREWQEEAENQSYRRREWFWPGEVYDQLKEQIQLVHMRETIAALDPWGDIL